MFIKNIEDAQNFVENIKNYSEKQYNCDEQKNVYKYVYHDSTICTHGGSTTIQIDNEGNYSIYNQGANGWNDIQPQQMEKNELIEYLYKHRYQFNKDRKDLEIALGWC